MSRSLLAVLCLAPVLSAAPRTQSPDAEWRTIRTAHAFVHYPVVLEAWAKEVASEVEGIHAAVTKAVGRASARPVHLVLRDPVLQPNGITVPILPFPYVELWRTEPDSDLAIGEPQPWTELLVTHELAHVHHLTWPQNRPRWYERGALLATLGPLTLKAPAWVMEGFATVVEGKVTGMGRPHSAVRAALLRQWSLEGKLPEYDELDAASAFMGGSVGRYMTGSAYLEWLQKRHAEDPDILGKLWRQLASRRRRGFEEAFRATFGYGAKDGYDRFRAELAHDALAVEHALKAAGLREGALWQSLPGEVGHLSVSPDGTRLLARVVESRGRRQGPTLRIWDLGAKPEAPKAKPDPDPEEVEDRAPEVPARPAARVLPVWNGQVPDEGWWGADGRVAVRLRRVTGEMTLARAGGRWSPGRGLEAAADPGPDPLELKPLARKGRWVLELAGRELPLPGSAAGLGRLDSAKRWVYAGCEVEGIWNLVRVPVRWEGEVPSFGAAEVLTRTVGAAWNPAPTPDGKAVFYTQLRPGGMEIRRLELDPAPVALAPAKEVPELLTRGAVMPEPAAPSLLPPPVAPPLPHPYRALEAPWIRLGSGLFAGPSGRTVELGLAGQDAIGRLSWEVMAGLPLDSGSLAGPRGGTAALAWRGWAWAPSVQVFGDQERPSQQGIRPVAGLDRDRRGAELAFTFESQGATGYAVRPWAAWERVAFREAGSVGRSLAGLSFQGGIFRGRGPWSLQGKVSALAASGRTGGEGWSLGRLEAQAVWRTPWGGGRVLGEAGALSGRPSVLDCFHLGGVTGNLVPLGLEPNRVAQPALPAYAETGDRLARVRVEFGNVVHAYLEQAALWTSGASRGPAQGVAGLELDMGRLPAGWTLLERSLRSTRLAMGLHRTLNGPLDRQTVFTLQVAVRP